MLTQERLKELFSYNPETGLFIRIMRSGKNCSAIGSISGSIDIYGYLCIKVDKKSYKAHRLAFLYMNGTLPLCQVDHINRKRHDNRWANLREASASSNAMNRKLNINNKYGKTGITRRPNRNIWIAQAMVEGKTTIRFFPDSRYGSSESAFKAASDYISKTRDNLGFSNTHGINI